MNIGLAIKTIRKELHIKQYQLALSCGISHTSLCLIENGVKLPSSVTFDKLCSELNVPEILVYIMGLEEADMHDDKKETYRQVHPLISGLVMLGVNHEMNYCNIDAAALKIAI